mmetsp:Transcript_9925/g.9819  ORF Transcript_9925/g.9819 Transcript_9925/m.9819 type:complete len:111 (+) Transcript_9925:67-399(+)
MDKVVDQLYQVDKANLKQYIYEQVQQEGEEIINLRDSSGNCLIHHLCTIFSNEEVELFKGNLQFLLSAQMSQTKEEMEMKTTQNFMKGLPLAVSYEKKSFQEFGLEPGSG